MEFDRNFYLCPPDYLEFKYIINPWMDKSNHFKKKVAHKQWDNLYELYESLLPSEHLNKVIAKEGLEELCFFGDSVFAYKNKAVFSRFATKERYTETEYVMNYLSNHNITGNRVSESILFEGSGETMLWNNRILVGYGQRSNSRIIPFLENEFKMPVVGLELINPSFYHLDTALFPISDQYIAVYEKAFSEESKITIRNLNAEILYLDEEDATAFALNSICIGNTVILHYKANKFKKKLEQLNFDVQTIDIGEYIKFGGGLKCLTFQHYL